MLILLLIIAVTSIIVSLFWLFNRKRTKWLKHGKFLRNSSFVIHKNNYWMEEIKLKSYREAFGAYEKNIEEICLYGKVIDMKYDLYDWTVSYVKFKDITIGIKLYRPLNTVQLIQSEGPIPILTMETDNPFDN
jgi:hypothetical protein